MYSETEISSLDLRYESCRIKSRLLEDKLLPSFLRDGIKEPLQCIETKSGTKILLDGFKRYRCALKLNIHIVPYTSLSSDEALGIIKFLRISNSQNLTILEQAKLIDELRNVHKMSVSEIALHLDRSKGWAGMRVGLIGEMSELVMNEILNGKFPVYSYMYTIRSFMRMNGIKKEEIDKFVCSVSGRGISIRDIEILAQGYFKGSESIRNEINNGNISFGLNFLRDAFDHSTGCSKLEQRMLIDLGLIQKYIHRVINNDSAQKLFMSNSFNVQANLLTGSILRQMDIFLKIIKGYYDKSRQEESSLSSS